MTVQSRLRDLPGISTLLAANELRRAVERFGQPAVTDVAREVIDGLRSALVAGSTAEIPSADSIAARIVETLNARHSLLRPVINATGILLHTNLGRAPLAPAAAAAAREAGAAYCSVELDLSSGKRSKRAQAVSGAIRRLTGAEAAHVVNNNAGGLGLTLGALAAGREIIVSHGELIEIGGGYRLPEVIEIFGARLRGVGATNKTRASDYAQAIGAETAVLLSVHPSNYQVSGFTERPRIDELAAIARQSNIPLVHDIGSGALLDLEPFGIRDEPVASRSIAAGADVVLFSGDKLLGGPQCGVIAGRSDLVESIAQHPLNRALRVDKMTLAALRVTLEIYERGKQTEKVPLLRMLSTSPEVIQLRTRDAAASLSEKLTGCRIEVIEDSAFLGGGTAPEQALPSWSMVLASPQRSASDLACALRMSEPAVAPRVQHDRLILSLHAVLPEDDERLVAAVAASIS